MTNRKRIVRLTLAATVLVLGGLWTVGCTGSSDLIQQVEIRTEPFPEVALGDRPPAAHRLSFPSFDQPRLLWITGIRAEMVQRDDTPAATVPAYRTDIGFEYVRHARIHQLPIYHTDRLFTLTERQTRIGFPDGFGMPFYSDENFTVSTKLLEASRPAGVSDLRQKVVLEYIFDRDLDEPMKPLFATSGRWVRGAEGARDRILKLPYDTHAHYITAPLRAGAGKAELLDLTTGEAVYDSARDAGGTEPDADGAAYASGTDGIALLEKHAYLVTDDRVESPDAEPEPGAALLLYARDKLFKKRLRQRAPVAHFDEPVRTSTERLVLHTDRGDIEIAFYPDVAPRHYKQILKLARLGVYDGMQFNRVEPDFLIQLGYAAQRVGPPLTEEQSAALRRLEAEFSDLPMKRWTVGMTLHDNAVPDSAVASFFILLKESRRIDQQYTIVGRVISGLGTLNSIANRQRKDGSSLDPAVIEKAEVKTISEIGEDRQLRRKRAQAETDK